MLGEDLKPSAMVYNISSATCIFRTGDLILLTKNLSVLNTTGSFCYPNAIAINYHLECFLFGTIDFILPNWSPTRGLGVHLGQKKSVCCSKCILNVLVFVCN